MSHPLKVCTIAEARWYFHNKIPIVFRTDQLDENVTLTVQSLAIENFSSIFIPDGDLMWKDSRNGTYGKILGWLNNDNPGPYTSKKSNPVFFYLSGQRAEIVKGHPLVYKESRLQVCSDPFNILSDDCLDETHVWIPYTS